MVSNSKFFSNEREFQREKAEDAKDIFSPASVLEVGYPDQDTLDMWECEVETVDPYTDEATHKIKFEAFLPDRRYDLVHLGSVLDYFDDPVGCLRKVKECGDVVLLQGRLNTYVSPYFKTKYWTPTKTWVEERAVLELGITKVEWIGFVGRQFFSICGRI